MLTGFKIRIHPNDEQIKKFYQYAGTARFMYNWSLAKIEEAYASGIKLKDVKLSNQLTIVQKEIEELKWLNDIPRKVKETAIEDCEEAFKRLIKGESKYPKFKSKKKSKIAFSFVSSGKFGTMPNVGRGKGSMNLNLNFKDKLTGEVSNSHITSRLNISFDGKYWYLSGSYEKEFDIIELTDEVIGIDLGTRKLATTNNGVKFKNINKTKKVRKLNKKLKRVQRSISRKYEMNKDGDKFIETKNISKQLIELRLIHRKLSNIRKNNIQQITAELVKTKPAKVVMEDLNISGMMKNRHMARHISEANWYYFINTMRWKCNKFNIEFVLADRFFPSSKNCSSCGHKKKDLRDEETYHCNNCNLTIDRDVNAAINLANYTV